MAGGDHHSGVALEVAYRKTELRCGAHTVEEVHFEPVGSQHRGGDLGKLATVVAAVVAHCGAQLRLAGKLLAHIVGQPLGGHGHSVAVHAVGAYAHDAAQSPRAKLQVTVETLVQLLRISLRHVADGLLGGLVILSVKPALGILLGAFVDVQCFDIHKP